MKTVMKITQNFLAIVSLKVTRTSRMIFSTFIYVLNRIKSL